MGVVGVLTGVVHGELRLVFDELSDSLLRGRGLTARRMNDSLLRISGLEPALRMRTTSARLKE